MNKEGHNSPCSWKLAGIILAVSICIGVNIVSAPVLRTGETAALAATTSQDANQRGEAGGGAGAQGNSVPATQQPTNPSVSAVTEAAVKLGVLSCVARINQVVTFLTANTQAGVFIFPVQTQPDQHVFSTSFESIRPDESTFYASASFFPNQDAVYDTVEYVEMGCEEVEKTIFKDLKRVGIVKKNIIMLDSGAVKVFLMPAGSGCVVIKKEVVRLP
jgi:hypothetical protein